MCIVSNAFRLQKQMNMRKDVISFTTRFCELYFTYDGGRFDKTQTIEAFFIESECKIQTFHGELVHISHHAFDSEKLKNLICLDCNIEYIYAKYFIHTQIALAWNFEYKFYIKKIEKI